MIKHFIHKLKSNQDSFSLFAGNGLVVFSNFALLAFLSYVLPITEYGSYRQLTTFIVIGITIGSLGFSQALYFFLSKAKNDKQEQYNVINAARALVLFGAITSVFWMFFLFGYFSIEFNNPMFNDLVGFGFLIALVGILQSIELNSFLCLKKLRFYFVGFLCITVVQFIFLAFCYYSSAPINDYLTVILLASITRLLVNTIYIEKYFAGCKVNVVLEKLAQLLQYALPIGLGIICGTIMLNADKVILMHFETSPEAFAILSNGTFEVPLIANYYLAFATVALPAMILAWEKGDMRQMHHVRHQYIRLVAPVLFPVVIGFIIWSESLITLLFSSTYIESASIFAIFSFITLVRFCSHHDIFLASGKTKFILLLQFIEVLVFIFLCFWLIEKYGIMGAPIAALITNYAYFIVTSIISARISKTSISALFPNKFLLRVIFSVLVPTFLIYTLNYLDIDVITNYWWMGIPIFAAIYLCLFFIFIKDKSLNNA